MKLSETAKNMILVILASSAVFILICVLFYRSFAFVPFAAGVLMGAGLNIIKVIMLEKAVEKAVTLEQKAAGSYLSGQYLLRFMMTGAVLAAAAIAPDKFVSLWGAAAGILTLQIAAFSMKFFVRDEIKGQSEKAGYISGQGEAFTKPEEENKEEESVEPANGNEAPEPADVRDTVPESVEKQRIKKKPSDRRADKRMKKKPSRRYR